MSVTPYYFLARFSISSNFLGVKKPHLNSRVTETSAKILVLVLDEDLEMYFSCSSTQGVTAPSVYCSGEGEGEGGSI